MELIRRVDSKQAFALTTPLLTTSSGAKMGKTAAGAVWLNADLMSPYDYWQFWRNTEDADVGRFMKLFTDLPLDEIARYEALRGAEINEAKKALADAACALLHGSDAAATARATAETTFEQGQVSADLPTVEVPKAEIDAGAPLANLAETAGLARLARRSPSPGPGRRPARQRRRLARRRQAGHGGRHRGRDHQGRRGQEEDRADPAGLTDIDRRAGQERETTKAPRPPSSPRETRVSLVSLVSLVVK